MTLPPLYPLQFVPIYKEKIWGGRTIATLGRNLPGDQNTHVGESWELVDLDQTSPTGGGGGGERSVVANGPLAGKTLHQVMALYGNKLMGRLRPTKSGHFPLLVKYLDARENLSLQHNPSPAYVRAHPASAFLKSEAWYVVHAEPGATLFKGIKAGVSPEEFRAALASDDTRRVEELLIRVPVKVGDCHYVPSGVCHALGAGIMVAEVQTPSDTTFRVFDWGRGRELQIEEALACIEFGPPDVGKIERRSHIAGIFTAVSRLVFCEHFRIEKVRMSESYEQEIPYDQPAVWVVLQGRGRISPGNGADDVVFSRGQTLLIPAEMNNARVKLDEDTVWLETTFPQAQAEQIA